MPVDVTNIAVVGLGGQGVLKASDIIADAAFRAGLDVKKSELHGMSQRGGSVSSDIRFGREVLSPMIPSGEVDFLVVIEGDQVEPNRHYLNSHSVMITPEIIPADALENKKSLNVALLGALSRFLKIPDSDWQAAIRANLPEKLHDLNARAFAAGAAAAKP